MSIRANIDLNIISQTLEPFDVILLLLNNGWKIYDNGKKVILPLNDDMFDWLSIDADDDEVLSILKKKNTLKEILGVSLSWGNTNIGGEFLLYPDGSVSILLNNNRQVIANNITDFNWYLSKLLPILQTKDIYVESITCEQFM